MHVIKGGNVLCVSDPVRGNSKYHYYGLRIKAGSSLLRLMEDQQHLAMRQQPFSQKQRCTAHPVKRTHTYIHTRTHCSFIHFIAATKNNAIYHINAAKTFIYSTRYYI